MRDFYNKHFVAGWWRTWSVWLAALAIVLPGGLQWLLDNMALLSAFQMTDSNKETLRVILVALIPLARSLRQKALEAKMEREGVPKERQP